jgi:uncharacterized protein
VSVWGLGALLHGGGAGNRTRVQGFAGPCLSHSATPPGRVTLAVREHPLPWPGVGWGSRAGGGGGLLCGAVNALAGGGSLILFPALVATGMGTARRPTSPTRWPPGPATSAASTGSAPSSTSSAAICRARRRRHRGCARRLTPAPPHPNDAFDQVVPVLVLVAALLLAVQPRLARRVGSPRHRPAGRHRGQEVSVVRREHLRRLLRCGARRHPAGGARRSRSTPPLRRLNGLKAGAVPGRGFGQRGGLRPVRSGEWAAVAVAAPATLVGGYLGARSPVGCPTRCCERWWWCWRWWCRSPSAGVAPSDPRAVGAVGWRDGWSYSRWGTGVLAGHAGEEGVGVGLAARGIVGSGGAVASLGDRGRRWWRRRALQDAARPAGGRTWPRGGLHALALRPRRDRCGSALQPRRTPDDRQRTKAVRAIGALAPSMHPSTASR